MFWFASQKINNVSTTHKKSIEIPNVSVSQSLFYFQINFSLVLENYVDNIQLLYHFN